MRTLTPAHDQDDRQRGIESKFFRGNSAVDPFQTATHGRAGHHAMSLVQVIAAAGKTEQRFVHPWRDHPGHPTGDGIRLVNQGGQMEAPPEEQRDSAGKPAHAHHRGGLEIAIDLTTFPPTAA